MAGWLAGDGTVCAALMAGGGLLLALRLRPGPARLAWAVLLIAGLANAAALSLPASNLININVVHYYMGAKYAFPYTGCYRVINAALERPQVAMRDLERPPAVEREDPRAQRAYYIDLLRGEGLGPDPLAPLEVLRAQAEASGVIRAEADRILSEHLPEEQVEGFRRDARLALLEWDAEANIRDQGRDITWDYGFNGSPLYTLVRKLDPTLHRPFGPGTALLNLLWQTLAALLTAWIVGAALGADLNGRLAMAVLLFASWDFVSWALPGLVFAGLWLPIALALLAMRRRAAGSAGVAIAWAGLVKLFPFILALPHVVRALRAFTARGDGTSGETAPRWSARVLIWCALATPVLAGLAMLGGRSWADFLHKILVQFQGGGYLVNSTSLSQGILILGGYGADSHLPALLAPLCLAALAGMFLRGGDEDFMESLPRRSLVLLAATGWLINTWFNYYAVAPLLLLPVVARRHRAGAAVAALSMAAAFLLPEFDDPRYMLGAHSMMHAAKVAPYILIPAWLVWIELRALGPLRRPWRTAATAVALLSLTATAAEAFRMREIRRVDEVAGRHLDQGDPQGALRGYRRLAMLAPGNAMARMNEAIALAYLGRNEEAGASFARAAALDPGSPQARLNHGRWLLGAGRIEEAAAEMESARELAPHDDAVLYDLARVRLRQGRNGEARQLLLRARELNPQNRNVAALLERVPGS